MSLHSTPEDRHAAFGDDWKPLDYPELVHPEPRADEPPVYDHKAEAEQAARAGKYEIAAFHALMWIGTSLEPKTGDIYELRFKR